MSRSSFSTENHVRHLKDFASEEDLCISSLFRVRGLWFVFVASEDNAWDCKNGSLIHFCVGEIKALSEALFFSPFFFSPLYLVRLLAIFSLISFLSFFFLLVLTKTFASGMML